MYEIPGIQVLHGTLPAGDAGTARTLEIMRQLAQEGAKQLEVRQAAITILRRARAPEHNHVAQLRALFHFVRDRILFIGDVAGVETLQSPRVTLELGAGDCDDRATLLVSLARAVGIPAALKFRVIAANPRNPRAFSHVYVVAQTRAGEIAMDPTYRRNALGYEYPRASRVGEVPA